MPNHTTPDDLDELDRRVYDLAIQPIPLAEIAVRLGVPVPQADEKLQRLFRRLGVEDRAGLRALTNDPPVEPHADSSSNADIVIGEDTEEDRSEPEPRRLSRRVLLGAAAGVAVAAFGGGTALGWRGRVNDGNSGAASSSTPTPPAGNLPDLPDGAFPVTRMGGLGPTFSKQEWASSEPIEWRQGLFAMSTETGRISGWQLITPEVRSPEFARYRFLGDGRFVIGEAGGVGWILDREAEHEALRWELGPYSLLEAFGVPNGPKHFLFESTSDQGSTLHFVHDLGPSVVERTKVTIAEVGPPLRREVLKEPGGKRVAVFAGSAEQPNVAMFDLTTGERLATYDLQARTETSGVALALPFQRINGGFLLRWMTTTNGRGDIPRRFLSWPIRWQGDQLAPARDEDANVFYSPDGITAAQETVPSYPSAAPPNGFPRTAWPSVGVLRGRDEPFDFRLRSASLLYGDNLPPNRWLRDETGFVAAVRGSSPSHNRYAIVRGPDRPIEVLPAPPEASREWYDTSWVCGPVPSPESPVLLSFGRLYLYNLKSQQWFSAQLSDSGGPAHLDPWSGGPGEMVFALPHGGHGGSELPILLAPKLEKPPFDDTHNLVVEVDPEGLNLRDAPSLSAGVLDLLKNGDRLTLIVSPDGDSASTFNTNFNEDALWLRVRTESGLEGWVNSAWIAWA